MQLIFHSLLATNLSESSTKVTMATSEAVVLSVPVWVAERHEDDWTATVGSEQAVIEDCCADGAAILSRMNPESLQMPVGVRSCSLLVVSMSLT